MSLRAYALRKVSDGMLRFARFGFRPYLWAGNNISGRSGPVGALGSPYSLGLVDSRFHAGTVGDGFSGDPAVSRAFRKLLTSLLPWPASPCGFRLCAQVPPHHDY